MEKSNYLTGDVDFQSNSLAFTFYKEGTSLALQKNDYGYVISGFNGVNSKQITEQIMEKEYLNFLRALKLMRPDKYRNKEIK